MVSSRWDVMGSTAGFSLMQETLGNIREVAPSTAFECGEPSRLVPGDGPATSDAASAFVSGVGSLANTSA